MSPQDQQYFVRRVIAGGNVNTIKKDGKMYMTRILNDLRRSNADKISEFLKELEIKPQNIDRVMKKFATTYINMNTLKKEATKIENFRNHGNWVESNDEFLNFVDELPLDPEDNIKIKSNFNSDLVNFNTAVNTAIKTALNTQDEKTNSIRRDLMEYINKHQLNNYNKQTLLHKLNVNENENENENENTNETRSKKMINLKKKSIHSQSLN